MVYLYVQWNSPRRARSAGVLLRLLLPAGTFSPVSPEGRVDHVRSDGFAELGLDGLVFPQGSLNRPGNGSANDEGQASE